MTPHQEPQGHIYGVNASYGQSMLHAGDVHGNITTTNNYEKELGGIFSKLTAGERQRKLLEIARTGQEIRLRFMLRLDIDLEYKSPVGNTALHEALLHTKPECARLLITHGADVNSCGEKGYTPLILSAEDNDQETTELLLKNGAVVESYDYQGLSPLMKASRGGHQTIVHNLVEKGANVKTVDMYGWTALLYAANNGHQDVVRDLCKYGSDLEARGPDGRTALMRAALEGHADVVALLLEVGANPHVNTYQGWTPLLDAADRGHFYVAQRLLPRRIDLEAMGGSTKWTALLRAACRGHTDMVTLLLIRGANPQAATSGGWTSLHFASKRADLAVSEDLLECQSNLSSDNSEEWQAVVQVPDSDAFNVVALLLRSGANPQAKTQGGLTALMLAASNGLIGVVQELLRHRPGIDDTDRHGQTALMYAALNGRNDVAQKLLVNGANPAMKNIAGQRPEQIAFEAGHEALAGMLQEAAKSTKAEKVSYRLERLNVNQ